MNLTITGVLESGGTRRPGVPSNPRTPITIVQGVTAKLFVPIVNPDGSAVALGAGDKLEWAVKKKPTDNPPLILKTATYLTTEAGVPYFVLAPTDTKQMEAGRYVWDVWLTRVIGLDTFRDPVIPQSPMVLEASVVPVP